MVCTDFCPYSSQPLVAPGKGAGKGGLQSQHTLLPSRAPEQHLPGAEQLGGLLHLPIFWKPLVSWKPIFSRNPCFPKSHLPHHFSPRASQPLHILPYFFPDLKSLFTTPQLSTSILPQWIPVSIPILSVSTEFSPPQFTRLLSQLFPGHSCTSSLSSMPLCCFPPLQHSSPTPLPG